MLPATLQPFLDWLALHPTWAGVAVFLIAASESLAVVGLFVPGALLLFGIGALVAAGSLDLVPTLAWATAGAVAGDGLSFWLGRHFHQRLRLLWPFSRSPELMARAVDFFDRHGGKSVVMARFVGPLRPIIPAVAGMMDMSPARFFWINVLSAAVWAPAYILPGMALGASLQLAAQVAGRLVVLIVLLLAAVWLCLWLVRQVFRLVQPHASALIGRALDWSRGHPVIRPLAGALLDPEHPEARGLAMLAIILVVTAWLFAAVLAAVVHGSPLQGLDLLLYRWLQNLRTPWADRVMVALTELGDATVLTAVVTATALWLAWRRRWKALGHWLATAAGAAIMVRILKLTLQVPRPTPLYEGAGMFAFPSAHAGTNLAVYGFLAVLVARELAPERRWLPYVGAAALIVLIAFSRLYLGAHWLSDVIGGLALGLSWTALMGIAYRRHPAPPVALRGLLAVVLVALTAAGSWQISRHLDTDLVRYARRQTTVTLAPSVWWSSGWRELPAYRMDLEGEHEHPLTVQWAGSLPTLKATLTRHGWRTPAAATVADSLRWLSPATPFRDLPVLPQVHTGRHEALLLTHATDNPDRLLVLRLWPTAVVLGSRQRPVWIGNVSELIREQLLGFVTLPHTARDYDAPLRVLAGDLAGLDVKVVQRRAPRRKGEEAPRWDGRVLLIRNPPADGAPTADQRPGGTLPEQVR